MRNRFAVNNAIVLGCMAEDAVKWLSQWFKNKRVLNIFGSSISTEMYSLIYFVRRQVFGGAKTKPQPKMIRDEKPPLSLIHSNQNSLFLSHSQLRVFLSAFL